MTNARGTSSLSKIFNLSNPPSPGPGQHRATSQTDANSQTDPQINTIVAGHPINFILGTPGGANNPNAVSDGTNAVFPINNGDPEFATSMGDLVGADATTDPADLDPSEWAAWTQQQQLAYLELWNRSTAVIGASSANPSSEVFVSVSSSGAVSTQTLADYASQTLDAGLTSVDPSLSIAANLGTAGALAPADLDPAVYDSWTNRQVTAYLKLHNITSTFVVGSNLNPSTAIVVPLSDRNQNLSGPAISLAAWGQGVGTAPADLDPNLWQSWSQQEQLAYFKLWNLSSALIGSNTNNASLAVYAAIDSTGAVTSESLGTYATQTLNSGLPSVDLTIPVDLTMPEEATAPENLDPATYNSWTTAQRVAYAAYRHITGPFAVGSNVNPAAAIVAQPDGSSVSLATWEQQQAKALNPSKPTFDASLAGIPYDLGPNGGIAPANLDPTIFSHWTSEQQAEYIRLWQPVIESQTYGGSLANYNAAQTQAGLPTITDWSQESFVIGSAVSSAPITAVLSSTNPNRVWIVNNLQANDIAAMSTADQNAIAATALFNTPQFQAKTQLSLTSNSTAKSIIQSDVDQIAGHLPTNFYVTLPSSLPSESQPAVSSVPDVGSSVTSDGVNTTYSSVTAAPGRYPVSITFTVNPKTNVGSLTEAIYGTDSSGQLVATTYVWNNVSTSTTGAGSDLHFTFASSAPTTLADGLVIPSSTATMQLSSSNVFLRAPTSASTITLPTTAYALGVQGDPNAATTPINTMSLADRKVFIDELTILYSQVSNTNLINQTNVSTATTNIMNRFDQAAFYAAQLTPVTPVPGAPTSGVVSLDNNASINSTYQTFMQQERSILAAAQNEYSLSQPPTAGSPALDAPVSTMIGLTDMSNSEQAQIAIETAQLQQIQQVLQELSTLQDAVNATVESLGNDTTTRVGLLQKNFSELSPEDQKLVEMFDSMLNNNGNSAPPIFKQFGITMPQLSLYSSNDALSAYTADSWNKIGAQLSGLVTQLQQQAQTLTTDVNQKTSMLNNMYTEMTSVASTMGTDLNQTATALD